ncbi:hypothetical protein ABPG74_021045, partial [Tetrahymena malaccensis]
KTNNMEQKIVFQKCSRNELTYQLNCFSRASNLNFTEETKEDGGNNFVKFDTKKQKEVKDKLVKQGYAVQELPSWINYALEYLENKYQQQNIVGNKTFQDNHLLKYQQEAIKLIIQRNGNIILADEQFLGKSLIALKVAQEFRMAWPLLIITSGFKKTQWSEYIKEYIQNISENDILVIDKSSQQVQKKYQVVIIQYEVCSKFVKYLQQFQIAIADDVHQLKCYSTQKSQALIPVLSQMKHKILITSNIFCQVHMITLFFQTDKFQELKPKHVYNFLKILFPLFFKYAKLFLERFCDPRPSQFMQGKFDYEGVSCGIELDYILSLCVIKRNFQDVYNQLPQLIYKKIYLKDESSKIQKIQQLFSIKRIQNVIQLLINIKRHHQQIPIQEQVAFLIFNMQQILLFYAQKIISDELLELQTLSWQAKGKSILKFFKDLELKNEKLLVVAKQESSKQILAKLFGDLSFNFLYIQNMSQLIENIEKENSIQTINDSPFYYIIDYDIQIPQQFLNVDYIIFFDLFHFQFQKAIQIANSKNKKIKCLFLMNSGSLDEIIYKILFQEMNIDNVQQLLKEVSAKKQLISVPSTKVKLKKQKSQIQTEKMQQIDKQQTIDKYIFKSEISCHPQIQTTSDQMFYFDEIEDSSQQQVNKTKEKTCQSQLKPNTKRNLNEQFENIEYITPQRVVNKQYVEQYQSNKNSSELINMIDIESNQIVSFDTFMKTDKSIFNLLENPVKDEKSDISEQKSQKQQALAQQNIQKSKSESAFIEKSVKQNLQSQFIQVCQVDKLQNANNEQVQLDEWLQKLIDKKQANQKFLSQNNKSKDNYQQIQIKAKSSNLNEVKKTDQVEQNCSNDLPNKIFQIKSSSTLEQEHKINHNQSRSYKQSVMKCEKNIQIPQNDLNQQEKAKSKEQKQNEEKLYNQQDKLKQRICIQESPKEEQIFDVKKEIAALFSQIFNKQCFEKVVNDPTLENLKKSINSDITKLLQESQNKLKGNQTFQSKIQIQDVDLNNKNLGTFEFIDQLYNFDKTKDNIESLTEQTNLNESKVQENINVLKPSSQVEQNAKEEKTIVVDSTFKIFLNQM